MQIRMQKIHHTMKRATASFETVASATRVMMVHLESQPQRQRHRGGTRPAVAIGLAIVVLSGACGSAADPTSSATELSPDVTEAPSATVGSSSSSAISTTELPTTEAPTTTEQSLLEQLPAVQVNDLAAEPSAGCGAPPPNTERSILTVAGVDRDYELFLPSTYSNEVPRPLVLNIHGVNDSAAGQRTYSDFDTKAEAEGLVVL